jgi:colicin import membrane protein
MAKEDLQKPKRTRRSKAEIQQEFDLLAKEEIETMSLTTPKAKEVVRFQEQELIESVKDISSDETIRKFADLNIEISKTLSSLSEKIVREAETLAKLRQAVEIEKKELEKLYKLDLAQTALDQLIEEYQINKDKFEEEISNQKEQWEIEKQQRETEAEEEMEILTKSRKRETEEYEYKKALERKKSQDKYEEELRLRDKQNKEKQEALDKSWQLREESLKSQETELLSLRKTVDGYSAQLQKETEKAVTEAIRRTEQKLAHEIELLKRDNDSEKRMADLKIKTLEESLLRQLAQATSMQEQLEVAKKQVQDIAVKAIEGASGAKAFQIALEQTKGRSITA